MSEGSAEFTGQLASGMSTVAATQRLFQTQSLDGVTHPDTSQYFNVLCT